MSSRELEPLGVYQHWKGGYYRLLHHALDSEDCRWRKVVYVQLSKGIIWVRPHELWSAEVKWPDGSIGPRFRYVGSSVPGQALLPWAKHGRAQ